MPAATGVEPYAVAPLSISRKTGCGIHHSTQGSAVHFRSFAMRKFACAAIASAFVLAAAAPNTASAMPVPVAHPAVIAGSSSTAGAWAAGGIIGVAAFLVSYDLIRRTTCSGDFLRLGGPGFTEPLPNGNVMIPQCPTGKHKRR
jgi:hypothetical protein